MTRYWRERGSAVARHSGRHLRRGAGNQFGVSTSPLRYGRLVALRPPSLVPRRLVREHLGLADARQVLARPSSIRSLSPRASITVKKVRTPKSGNSFPISATRRVVALRFGQDLRGQFEFLTTTLSGAGRRSNQARSAANGRVGGVAETATVVSYRQDCRQLTVRSSSTLAASSYPAILRYSHRLGGHTVTDAPRSNSTIRSARPRCFISSMKSDRSEANTP
jgi:hypothetical protein